MTKVELENELDFSNKNLADIYKKLAISENKLIASERELLTVSKNLSDHKKIRHDIMIRTESITSMIDDYLKFRHGTSIDVLCSDEYVQVGQVVKSAIDAKTDTEDCVFIKLVRGQLVVL